MVIRRLMGGIEFKDERIECKTCGEVFYISPSEQLRWGQLGFQLPKRCPLCRRKGRHAELAAGKSNFDDADFQRVIAQARAEIEKWR
jgi:hypothetical protein